MKRELLLSAAALLIAGAALAEDFWTTKQYLQWTDDEVRRLMTNSPWAKDVTVSAPVSALGVRGERAGGSTAPTDVEQTGGGGGRGGRRRGSAADGFSDAGAPQAALTLNISWRSALPLRQALVRSRVGAGARVIPSEAEELIGKDQTDYVIVVTGVPAGLARTLEAPDAARQVTLRAGKKDAVPAANIEIQRRTRSVDLVLAFPKTEAIAAEDKEVEIVVRLGQIQAKKKFNLKEMLYNGKLEL